MGSAGRPLFGVILKPRQGLTPELAASIAEAATKGGADYIIDDEVLVNPPSCRLVERVKKIVSVCEPVARRRERPLLYIANVTARPSRVMAWIDQLQELEQNEVRLGLMVNGLVMGFETVTDIRNAMPQWPLIATTVTCGMVVLSPQYNISEHILVQLSRLVGADAVYAVRHATEYAFDPSKIHTILSHLGRQEHLTKPSMPIYAGAINLGTILRDELPRSPEFMVQAGTTVCGYEQVGQSFPETITTATRILVDALTSIYCDGLTGHELAERLVHDNNRHAKRANLSRLGLSP
jgi:ribulose 1,5-bisphosphate carboxylase large subunit-like protein